MSTPVNDSASEERQNVAYVESTSWLAKVHPYFKNPAHVLVLKLDCLLLVWAFIAGLFKVCTYPFFLVNCDVDDFIGYGSIGDDSCVCLGDERRSQALRQ